MIRIEIVILRYPGLGSVKSNRFFWSCQCDQKLFVVRILTGLSFTLLVALLNKTMSATALQKN